MLPVNLSYKSKPILCLSTLAEMKHGLWHICAFQNLSEFYNCKCFTLTISQVPYA